MAQLFCCPNMFGRDRTESSNSEMHKHITKTVKEAEKQEAQTKALREELRAKEAKYHARKTQAVADEDEHLALTAAKIVAQQDRIRAMRDTKLEADYVRENMIDMMSKPPYPEPGAGTKDRYRELLLDNRATWANAVTQERALENSITMGISKLEEQLATPNGDFDTAVRHRNQCQRWLRMFRIEYDQIKRGARERLSQDTHFCDERYDHIKLRLNGKETVYMLMW